MRIECKYDELMPLSEVEKRWHPDNENSHPEEQVRSLAKVIAKIGIRHAIHISKQSGKIAGGHGRYLAFKKLGYSEVPIVWENFKDEIEELNYRASDNLGQYAEFNNHDYVLNLEKAGLDLKEIDLEEFGVIDFEIPTIEELDPQTDEDEVPEVEHPITRRGDIWLLGKHRLMCGDSTMINDVEKLMNGEKADMVFTDPPYGINIGKQSQGKGGGVAKKIDYGRNDWDSKIPCEAISNCFLISDNQLMFGANYYAEKLPPSQCWIVWDKDNGESDFADCELAWCSIDKASRLFKYRWAGMLQQDMKNKEKRVHPTQKPVALSEWFFEKFNVGNVIADLFGGSGSTMLGCEKTNRKNYSMELDEKYCDVIINRWQNYTGKKATLEATGQTYEELKQERENV